MKRTLGFTLIEFILVVVIVGIIALMMIPKYSGVATFDRDSIAEQLKIDVRYAQSMAMAQNSTGSFVVNAGNYQVVKPNAGGTITTTLPSGVTLSAVQTITFDGDGVPGAATTITVTTSSGSRVLTLQAQTGFISG